MDLTGLKDQFPPSEVSWRIGQAGKTKDGKIWAKVLAYIDNRNIMDRLDTVVGPENWCNEFKVGPAGGVICGLSIQVAPDKWVTKWDGAENSDIESVKGGLSDSMKRAGVQWSIGRYLYDLGETWAEVLDGKRDGAHYANCKIKVGGQEEWATFYWLPPRDALAKLGAPASSPPTKTTPAKAQADALAKQHGMTTGDKVAKPAPNNTLPPDPSGAFDHVGSYRKRLAAADSPTALDDLLDFLKKNKSAMGDEYKSLLREWFERAIDSTDDAERLKELLSMTFKAKAALGDDAYIKLGLRADKKIPEEASA